MFPHHSRANECCQLAAQDPLVLLQEVEVFIVTGQCGGEGLGSAGLNSYL